MKNLIKTIIFLSALSVGLTIFFSKREIMNKKKIDLRTNEDIYQRQSDSLLEFYIEKKDSSKDWDSIFNVYLTKRDSIDNIYLIQKEKINKFYKK